MNPTKPIIASYADGGRYWPRTQREAGLEFKPWESRLEPLRSYAQEILRLAGIIISIGILWALAAAVT